MRHLTFILILSLSMTQLNGQFERKLSLNLSAGTFSTLGWSTFLPEGAANSDAEEPALMTNFKPGFSFSAGLQYNFSRHLSIEASFGRSVSNHWYYNIYEDNTVEINYLYYEIYTDTVNFIVQKSGQNELYLTALHFGLAPRYYFRPGKKFNPYLLAGLNVSYLDVWFDNIEYNDYVELGRGDEVSSADIPWADYSTNLGFNTGFGGEYTLGENLGLFFQARYHFVILGEFDFSEVPSYLDYHSVELHLGARISFLKSKDL